MPPSRDGHDALPPEHPEGAPALVIVEREEDLDALLAGDASRAPPALCLTGVARDYLGLGAPLTREFPTLRLPEPFPWPAPDQVHGREALTLHLPDAPYGHHVDIMGIVEALERGFAELTPEVRADWRRFWEDIEDLAYEEDGGSPVERAFPFAMLHRAVTNCAPYLSEERTRWHELRELLEAHRTCCAGAQVRVTRYWGW